MNKSLRHWMWVAGVVTSLGLTGSASAQTTFQPFKGLFGPKTTPEQKAEQKAPDTNRMTEIQTELAWLSDRATFPYYLEAHVKGSTLEVKGYVPSKVIREQALSLAKLNSPFPVVDVMKEHSSLAIRPVNRSPDQLKSSVQTALHEDFPRVKLIVQCQSDGTVQLTGTVKTFEQKLAISKTLRRLHGCASVTNLTQVENAGTPTQPSQAGTVAQTPSGNAGLAKASYQAPQGDPYESRGVVVVPSTEAPAFKAAALGPVTAPPATTPTPVPAALAPVSTPINPASKAPAMPGSSAAAAQLKKRIEATVPGAHNVVVTFTAKTDVRVECTIRPGDDSGAIAGQIYTVRELDPYKVDLQIQLPTVEQR